MRPMRHVFVVLGLGLLVVSCTPPEVDYCQSTGVPPLQLEQCTQHYFQQEAAFNHDFTFCAMEADQTYPRSLYSGWGTALVHNRSSRGGFSSVEQVSVPPDHYKNAQVDALRQRIVEPCMQSRGWNSGVTWKAGRRAPGKMSQMNPNGGTMPWLHK